MEHTTGGKYLFKKTGYIKAINFRTSMDVSYAHTFSRNEISLRNVLSGEIRCFESQHIYSITITALTTQL